MKEVITMERTSPSCRYCGNTMTLVTLSGEYPPDIQHQYQCLRCGSTAPKGTTAEDAYRKAHHKAPSEREE